MAGSASCDEHPEEEQTTTQALIIILWDLDFPEKTAEKKNSGRAEIYEMSLWT